MQTLVIEEPYRFIAPYEGDLWSEIFRPLLPTYLRLSHGIVDVNCRGVERLQESVRQGRGVLLAPNHCRLSDPMTMGWIVRETGIHTFTMASWHLFKQDRLFDRLSAWMMRRLGAFSILREGTDRAALTTAIDILATAKRPLILFPEGVVSRSNDRLGPLMEGVSFVAKMAAKKAAKEGRAGVVIHPVALRYVFLDDVERAVNPVLSELEARLTWRTEKDVPLHVRIERIEEGLLALREIEFLGRAEQGGKHERRRKLIEHLLGRIEEEWIGRRSEDHVVSRAKDIRAAILPKLLEPGLPAGERDRLRGQLHEAFIAQQLHFRPEAPLEPNAPPEHFLEAVERIEEDLTDRIRVYGRFRVLLDVGEAIEVPSGRERRTDREGDPLLEEVSGQLRTMLAASGGEVAASRGRNVRRDLVTQPQHVAAGT